MTFTVAGIEMSGTGTAVAALWPVSLLVVLAMWVRHKPGSALVHSLAVAGRWLSELESPRAGGHGSRVISYDWRYLDGAGHDVTEQVIHADMVVDVAEAVAERGQVLLTVRRRNGGWQISGGHLGDQADGATFATIYGSPYDAMLAVARQLGMTAKER